MCLLSRMETPKGVAHLEKGARNPTKVLWAFLCFKEGLIMSIRGTVINFKTSTQEKNLAQRVANAYGLTVSAWARSVIHSEARRLGFLPTPPAAKKAEVQNG